MKLHQIQMIHEIINKKDGLKHRNLGFTNIKLIKEFNEKIEAISELVAFYKRRDEIVAQEGVSRTALTTDQKAELLSLLAQDIDVDLQFSFNESDPVFDKNVTMDDLTIFYFLKK